MTETYPETNNTLDNIVRRYCPTKVTEAELQKKIDIFLIREFYAAAHETPKESKPVKVWFEEAVIQFLDRPKLITVISPTKVGISYDVCIPVNRYLKEAFGVNELHELYNNVVLEAQDLQEISCRILEDIKLWLDVVELDRQGKVKLDDLKEVSATGVCKKLQSA